MIWKDILHYSSFLVLLTACARPLGNYLFRVFSFEKTLSDPLLLPIERLLMKALGSAANPNMNWKEYFLSFFFFSCAGVALLFLMLTTQHLLPFPATVGQEYLTTPMTYDLALNTAISFATTTTWQAYGGETTMSYLSQILGLASQNFLAGAAGLAIGIAFIRSLAQSSSGEIGNFWRDLIRGVLWVLLPLSIPGALFLVWQGVPMNFDPYTVATTLQGDSQIIAQGPVAALEFIKNLGTNGGGFFNVNGAHPFENPSPISNFVEMLAIVILPAALCFTFGRMSGHMRHGWLLYGTMTLLFSAGLFGVHIAENLGNPALTKAAAPLEFASDPATAWTGNLEGKEVRFGTAGATLGVVTTSNGATGSYSSMHDSLTPAAGGIALFNMLLGELVYGGLGTGLISMIMVVLISVFVGGLMIGRSPVYMGHQLGSQEMKMIALYTLVSALVILPLTALAFMTEAGRAGLTTNSGPHGLTSVAFAFTSSFANNGQNFAGLSANSPFYNITTALAMLAGRFGALLPALALAGCFAERGRRDITSGSLATDSWLFAGLLLGTIIVVAGLSFLPLLCLGPLAEHLMLWD